MKRIAAVAALLVVMLAVPAAAAMASTASSGTGSGHPGQGQFCQPNQFNQFNHRHHGRHHGRHHMHQGFGFNQCPYFPFFPAPPSGFCQGQSFTFTWAHDSNSFYEESGPTLWAGEQFSYGGNVFTIGTANPGAGSYTSTTVNWGPSIFYGTGYICSSYG